MNTNSRDRLDWQGIILLSIVGIAFVWGSFFALYHRQYPKRPIPWNLMLWHRDGRAAMRDSFARRFGWPPYDGSPRYAPPVTPPRPYAR